MPFNCPDTNDFERKTLAQLRDAVIEGLGFLDPLTAGVGASQTLADLRDSILSMLGLSTPIVFATRTVSALRSDMAAMAGMGAMLGTLPPGFAEETLAFINKAQQIIFRRLELDNGGTAPPAQLALDSDTSSPDIDSDLLLNLATGYHKAKYGQPDAKAYFDAAEHQLADIVQRRPPNITDMVTKALINAHRTVIRRIEMGNNGATPNIPFAVDTDETVIDAEPVLLLALANLKAKIGQADAKTIMEQYEHYMADQVRRSPPNARSIVGRILKTVQDTLYRRYDVFRMERFFTWTLVPDQRFYGLGSNDGYRLATPSIASVIAEPVVSGPSLSAGTYSYRVSAYTGPSNRDGESAASVAVTVTSTGASACRITWSPVTGAVGYNVYGRTAGGEQLLVTSTDPSVLEFVDNGVRTPSGALPADSTGDFSSRRLDPRKVHWVGVSHDDNQWRPLRCGIPPVLYASPQSGVPTHYEVRQCIEVWPAPVDGWQLRMKGDFGLDPFEADNDLTTIDWQAVYLTALGEAKVHFKQDDAQLAVQNARVYIGDLIAGSHMTARYVPGSREPVNAVRPVLV